jgi:hypothetical protein
MHPIQDLFLESFSYVLQYDMHFYMHSYLDKKIYSCKKWVLQTFLEVSSSLMLFEYALCCTFEPRDVGHTLSDSSWVNAMHEELENFERNQVWTLVDPLRDVNVIGTKWFF